MNLCRLPFNLPTMLLGWNLGSFRWPHTGDWGSPDITLANSFLFCTLKMVESRPGNSQRTAKSGSQRSRNRQHCQAQRSRKHIDLLLTPSTIVQDLEITQRTIKGKKNLKKKPWTQLKWELETKKDKAFVNTMNFIISSMWHFINLSKHNIFRCFPNLRT